jgi:hypothetical protein
VTKGGWKIEVNYRADGSERQYRSRWVPCRHCRATGIGSGCHEQGGWISGLCPECCGHKGWMSNSEPVPGSRWRKTPRAAKAVDRYSGPGGIEAASRFTDPLLSSQEGP